MNWDSVMSENPFLDFNRKIIQVKKKLCLCEVGRQIGYFQQLLIREEVITIKENLFEEFPTPENKAVMRRTKAECVKYFNWKRVIDNKKLDMMGLKVVIETPNYFTV